MRASIFLLLAIFATLLLPGIALAQTAERCCVRTEEIGRYTNSRAFKPLFPQNIHNYNNSGTFSRDLNRAPRVSCQSRLSTGCLTQGEAQCLEGSYGDAGLDDWICLRYQRRIEVDVLCTDSRCGANTLLNSESCTGRGQTECDGAFASSCFWREGECLGRDDQRICYKLPKHLCEKGADGSTPGSRVCLWKAETGKCINKIQAGATASIDYSKPGAFPPCGLDGSCDSLNDLLAQQVGWANYAFSLIGVIGFLSFVIGGVQMITSFGNPEKFKKGTHLMVAAVIGLTIAFSAYLIVKFVLDALGVAPEFRGV